MNAYYTQGSNIVINAYATDIGGSGLPGEISSVDFYVDDALIGSSSDPLNNTFSISWVAEQNGEFRITATASDTLGKSFTSAGVLVRVGSDELEEIGLSAGKGKYLGNVVRDSGVEPGFMEYWNAVTSGNGGKWQTVEGTRDQMNWQKADEAYNLASSNHLPYRYHTLAWGSQYPGWITSLSPSAFQEEMEEFISAVAERYPYIDQIDVINEALPGHQEDTQYFIDGLGGEGESGYDWAVWLFKKARAYFPNAKLVLNDFALVNSRLNIQQQFQLLRVLRDSSLVDGFGAQAHTFNLDNMEAAELQENLDLMANAGIPIYITEMDMQGVTINEASQLSSYETLFPVLWEHPDVAGITLWGYIYGDMWKPDAGLVYADGTERSSMRWLKNYMNAQEDVGYPFSSSTTSMELLQAASSTPSVRLYQNPADGSYSLQNTSRLPEQIRIFDMYGRLLEQFDLPPHSSMQGTLPPGIYVLLTKDKAAFKILRQ
jgi:GH35 family endo-1,4-beta-xylanase